MSESEKLKLLNLSIQIQSNGKKYFLSKQSLFKLDCNYNTSNSDLVETYSRLNLTDSSQGTCLSF